MDVLVVVVDADAVVAGPYGNSTPLDHTLSCFLFHFVVRCDRGVCVRMSVCVLLARFDNY